MIVPIWTDFRPEPPLGRDFCPHVDSCGELAKKEAAGHAARMRPAFGVRSSLAAALLLVGSSGCIVTNNDHCANRRSTGPNSGDSYCAQEHDDSWVCTDGTCNPAGLDPQTGCAPGPVEDACHCPQGGCNLGGDESGETTNGDGDATSTGDGDSSETTETMGDGDAETMTSSTTMGDGDEGPECTEMDLHDPACGTEGDEIFCSDSGACVDCSGVADGNAACLAYNADLPICVGTSCAECGEDADCPLDNPVCGDDNSCGPCNAHASCPDSACNLETGACMDADPVIYVNGQTGNDDSGDGQTPGTAFATIQHAIDSVAALGTATVKVQSVPADYVEVVSVQGKTIALIGDGNPELIGNGGSGLSLLSGATVFVEGFTIRGSSFEGVNCSGPNLWLENTIVANNSGDGVSVASSCTAHLRNVMVSGHGSLMSTDTQVRNAGTLELSYSTLLGLSAQSGTADALECTGTTTIRNSIIIGLATDRVNCPGADVTNTAVNDSDFAGEASNTDPMTWMSSWFTDSDNGDLHLSAGAPAQFFGGVASLGSEDLPTDFDGQARDSMGYVGADEP